MPLKKKRILFIHHGSYDGGAPLSMLYTMKGAKSAGYEVMAGLINPRKKLHEFYNQNGIETINLEKVPRILTWGGSEGKRYNPLTWYYIFKALLSWKKGKIQLQEILKEKEIDLVHLNSVSLSNSAIHLNDVGFPFVWHVREYGPKHKGARYNFISKHLQNSAEVVFLSKAEQYSWTGKNELGTVVHNFIDFEKFSHDIKIDSLKEKFKGRKVILYVGGFHEFKGIEVVIDALVEIKSQFGDDFVCIMPGAAKEENKQDKYYKYIIQKIKSSDVEENCEVLPFSANIVDYFALCDVLIFPATIPHFARPVIEASAMKKPAVASDLRAIDELIIHGETGFLSESNNPNQLADYILKIFNNPELAHEMGEKGFEFAKREFEYNSQMKKIIKIYERLI